MVEGDSLVVLDLQVSSAQEFPGMAVAVLAVWSDRWGTSEGVLMTYGLGNEADDTSCLAGRLYECSLLSAHALKVDCTCHDRRSDHSQVDMLVLEGNAGQADHSLVVLGNRDESWDGSSPSSSSPSLPLGYLNAVSKVTPKGSPTAK